MTEPDREKTEIVSVEELARVGKEILVAHGATEAHATVQVGVLIEAELRGQHSHGIQRLPVLVGRIRSRALDPVAVPELTHPAEALTAVDGRHGFGPVSAFAAVDALAEQVARSGIAAATIRNANHLGMLAPYVERLTDAGLIGIAFTTSEALVHPWGGTRALVGTNPLAIGVPTGANTSPMILDMSTGAVSAGKILNHAARGIPIPLSWAIDAAGEPTTDAAAAGDGALSPFGGPKGYALGLALEVLVATLTGTALGTAVRGTLDTDHPSTKGDVILALTTRHGSGAGVAGYLDQIRATPTRDGDPPVAVPGDRARVSRAGRLRDGVPVPAAIWNAITDLRTDDWQCDE